MPARVRRLELSPSERRAARRINALLGAVPRLKADGWRLQVGQWASVNFGGVAERVTGAWLQARGVRVETLRISAPDGEVAVRILHPRRAPRGVVLDMHGGGWVVGSAGLNDHLNADLAAEAGLAVVSVDYRLLSETRGIFLPHAISDCASAARWLIDNRTGRFGDVPLFLSGQSAGAHLAAVTAMALRDEGRLGAVSACVFLYGVYDLSGTASVRAAGPDTLVLNGPTLAADLARLLPDRDEAGRRLPDMSPLHAAMRDLPPALFLAGDLDPLRDDSLHMADAWSSAASSELIEIPLAPHGFVHFGGPLATRALSEIRSWIESRLDSGPSDASIHNGASSV